MWVLKRFLNTLGFLKNLITESKTFFYIFIFVYILGIAAGFLLPANVKQSLFEGLMGKFSSFEVSGGLKLSMQIFKNNVLVLLMSLGTGFSLITPVLILLINGISVGILFDFARRAYVFDQNIFYSLVISIVPHGVIEIPVIIASLYFATLAWVKIYFPELILKGMNRKKFVGNIVLGFVMVFSPLLFIASLIEGNVTSKIYQSFTNLVVNYDEREYRNKILGEIDLIKVGLPLEEVSVEENWKYASLENSVFSTQPIMMFNEEFYSLLKELGKHKVIKRFFKNDGELLSINIFVYENEEKARNAFVVSQKINDLVWKNKDPESYEIIGDRLLFDKEKKRLVIINSGREGRYLYSVVYSKHAGESISNPKELALLARLAEEQGKRLIQ